MEARGALAVVAAMEALDLRQIQDEGAREAIVRLMNLVEQLAAENRSLREQVQRLQDELNRLKGQSPRPPVKGGKGPDRVNYSSEKERRQPQERQASSKLDKIVIDRDEPLVLDPATLPADAERKGYETVVVQDLAIRTDNVRFVREKWYSASAGESYLAPLPAGY